MYVALLLTLAAFVHHRWPLGTPSSTSVDPGHLQDVNDNERVPPRLMWDRQDIPSASTGAPDVCETCATMWIHKYPSDTLSPTTWIRQVPLRTCTTTPCDVSSTSTDVPEHLWNVNDYRRPSKTRERLLPTTPCERLLPLPSRE
ncbi:hypothetical protein TRIUR3_27354 [Triticum urartu]|uniref:Uncharacterized protein n=1 Tax=Triticum urartu TaxID=4572 RepID=M7ZYA5_TRIUA|nr:hypothetical protein TRIUR3_27354 [Triticum urartu]